MKKLEHIRYNGINDPNVICPHHNSKKDKNIVKNRNIHLNRYTCLECARIYDKIQLNR